MRGLWWSSKVSDSFVCYIGMVLGSNDYSKTPWRMSRGQKFRLRKRMQAVDDVIETVYNGLKSLGITNAKVDKMFFEFPKESEMKPFDKYFVFNRYSKGYRKGVHKVPKFTKISNRQNPKYF